MRICLAPDSSRRKDRRRRNDGGTSHGMDEGLIIRTFSVWMPHTPAAGRPRVNQRGKDGEGQMKKALVAAVLLGVVLASVLRLVGQPLLRAARGRGRLGEQR